jgi:hypothetical protein
MKDLADALFIMATPVAEVRSRIFDGSFDNAVAILADQVPANLLPALGKLLNKHLEAAFSAAIPYGPSDRSDANSPFPAARTPEPGTAGSPP